MFNMLFNSVLNELIVEFVDLETFNIDNDMIIRFDCDLNQITAINDNIINDNNRNFLVSDINKANSLLKEIGVI